MINLQKISVFRVFIASLAILATLYGYHMPEERLRLLPQEGRGITLYSDENWGGQTSVAWINEKNGHWQCHLAESEFAPVCGLSASLGTAQLPQDMTKYNALAVKLKYLGEASKLRIYLRNFNPAYSNPEDPDSLKFNSVNIPAREFNADETIVKLSEFSVEGWWLEERNIPRKLAYPEINKVVNIGIDYPYPQTLGEHSIQIESIDLIGVKFKKESYFMWLTIALACLICLEALTTLALIKRKAEASQKQNKPKEAEEPEQLTSVTLPSAQSDLTSKINMVFDKDKHLKNTSLILLKVNNHNESQTHINKAVEDTILDELFQLMSQTLRSTDTFTRWGEEEFLILSTDSPQSRALKLCKRIHKVIGEHTFTSEVKTTQTVEISMNIGGTCVKESDDFGTAFMRAEQALYRATDEQDNTYWQDI